MDDICEKNDQHTSGDFKKNQLPEIQFQLLITDEQLNIDSKINENCNEDGKDNDNEVDYEPQMIKQNFSLITPGRNHNQEEINESEMPNNTQIIGQQNFEINQNFQYQPFDIENSQKEEELIDPQIQNLDQKIINETEIQITENAQLKISNEETKEEFDNPQILLQQNQNNQKRVELEEKQDLKLNNEEDEDNNEAKIDEITSPQINEKPNKQKNKQNQKKKS